MRRCFEISIATLLLCGAAGAEVTNRVVARVNDRILTLYEYDTRFQEALQTLEELPQDAVERQETLDGLSRDVMRTLWDELLILSRADQEGMAVTDREIDEQVAAVMEATAIWCRLLKSTTASKELAGSGSASARAST